MKDKFRANFKIAIPAAVLTLILFIVLTISAPADHIEIAQYKVIMLIPYILVLICDLIGINVFVVLLIGIISGIVISLATGSLTFFTLLTNMGSGASGMYETIMVTVLFVP